PVTDEFTVPGDPNPGIWINSNAEINNRSVNPPTGPYALNLNGTPDGEDIVDLKPLDLSGMEGSDIFFSFFYQPQGNGNAPELVDSLQVYFKNDAGDWILVRFYEGVSLQPFQQEVIDIESAPNGGGSYFHGQFQVRLRSLGGASNLPNDDWFIDDVVLDVPTGLKASKILPTHYALDQNYPNPFNPTTTIAYQLPTISDVELTIYNVLGQKVRTLVDKRQTAGFYQIQWDGRNQFGEKVSSGIYIYKLKAADFVQSRKLILLK
ncbi:MAG: T9SS type A sorting domain-containing protein, partial [Aliifodinibius sp.]|nr:T9SS type A sorting domain-containing protein [Fodinibius sp.]NIV12698.1 T9SS type A sorting domain-containing protein [Fodinibius sp.]NIY27522.1 T9SS type A sorting domain-containing protein [Fodinibius sp.]